MKNTLLVSCLPAKASHLNGMRVGFLFLVSLPLLWNLLRPGFYTSHDGEWMVIRLTAFHQELRSGQIPVRWLSRLNHGYGYPVINFLYPLPFYLAEPFYILTKNPALAIKSILVLSILSAAIGQWVLLKKLGNVAALSGTLAYIYAPYFAYNIYQRGSVGEILAMSLIPWLFWALSKNKFSIASLLLAALILSHNVVAALFLPIILVYSFYKCYKNYNNYKPEILSLILGFALSAFFWAPALYEYRFVRASVINVSDFTNEYLSINQAFIRSGPITAIFSGGLSIVMLTNISQPFWNLFRSLQIIQFPWRLLSVFSFISSIFLSCLIQCIYRRSKIIAITFSSSLIVLTFAYAKNYLSPASFNNLPPSYYQTNADTTTARAEYTPIWVKNLPRNAPTISTLHYYPGIKVFSENQQLAISNPWATNGIIAPILKNNSPIMIKWGETPLRTISNIISVISLLFWLRYYPFQPRRISSSTID